MAATYARTSAGNGPLGALTGSGNLDSAASSRRRAAEQVAYGAGSRSPTRRTASQAPASTATTATTAAMAAPAEKKAKDKKAAHEKPTSLPDPPETVRDQDGVEWTRGRMLGSGGFARVYDAISAKGEMKAFKVIAKKHLQSKKTRQKVSRNGLLTESLWILLIIKLSFLIVQILAEIMIHSSFKHPNVVAFEQAFEDDEHVYFKLELCKAGVSSRWRA